MDQIDPSFYLDPIVKVVTVAESASAAPALQKDVSFIWSCYSYNIDRVLSSCVLW